MSSLTYDERIDFQDGLYDLLETYVDENILSWKRVSFKQDMLDDVVAYIREESCLEGWSEDDLEDEIEIVIDEVLAFLPPRQGGEGLQEKVADILKHLETFPKQKQRSPEWYLARGKLFSASNLWKLFGSLTQKNNLVVEKILPDLRVISDRIENIMGPLQWGIKYEPLTALIYEDMYSTRVNSEYGCIPHPSCPIGASPDGINIDPLSSKYGYMVEIKNIYNREMDGIPSEQYWIQIQIQLETCNLCFCDFVETRFKEYSYEDFIEDDRQYKGMVLYLIARDVEQSPKFMFSPLSRRGDENNWKLEIEETETEYVIYNVDYWYLDEIFCTVVQRNETWFAAAKPWIEIAWQEVLQGRVNEANVISSSLQLRPQKSKSIKNAVCLIKLPSEDDYFSGELEELDSDSYSESEDLSLVQ